MSSYRDDIAAEIVARIEAGTAPWQQPWQAGTLGAAPFNPVTGKSYRGINDLWLSLQGRADPRWMTYNQAAAAGLQVRKGAKGSTIEYWQWTERTIVRDAEGKPVLDDDGKQKTQETRLDRPRVHLATVFNAEQIDGLEPFAPPVAVAVPQLVEYAETLIAGAGVPVFHDQNGRAFYRPSTDEIHLPPLASFKDQVGYYETVLHELGHATGHSSRLNRDFGPFGGEKYAREELRAEISSYMLARDMGISFDPSNHAAYVESWLHALREDKNEIFRAARDAEMIKTWVMEPERRPELERAAGQQRMAQARTEAEGREQMVRTDTGTPAPAASRTYITVPYAEKDAARALGAKWDRAEKSWYVPEGQDPAAFAKWSGNAAQAAEPVPAQKADPVLSADDYERKILGALKNLPGGIAYHYLSDASSAYLGLGSQKTGYAGGIARVWNEDKLTEKEADLLLARTSVAGNWPVKAAEAMGLNDGLPAFADLARELPRLDWTYDYSDDYKVRQEESARISNVQKAATSLVATSREHAELASVVWDKLAPVNDRAPERRFAGYIPVDQRKTEMVTKLAGDPFAVVLAAHGLSAEHIRRQEPEMSPAVVSEQPKPRTYLAVPFAEKDAVKSLGAKWDRAEKSWYVPEGQDPAAFAKWSVKGAASAPALSPQEEFAGFLKANNLILDGAPEMDGKWHRVPTSSDKGKEKSGSYRGFLDGRPAGQVIAGWNAETVQWVSTGVALTDEERARIQAEAAQVRANREAERQAAVEQAAKTAYGVWKNLPETPTGTSPYLDRKGVGAHGVKIDGEGKVVVPARDADGKLWTLQFIGEDGKLWLKESQKSGSMHVVEPTGAGTLDSLRPNDPVIIAEGYATAARIFEASKRPVVVAFDCGNLLAVAEAVHAKFPDRPILLAADNDHARVNAAGVPENIGILKAQAAAKAVGGQVVAPQFTETEKAKGLTDFDDLGKARGNGAVRQSIEGALARMFGQERGVA